MKESLFQKPAVLRRPGEPETAGFNAAKSADAFIFNDRRMFLQQTLSEHPASFSSSTVNLFELRKSIVRDNSLPESFELDMDDEEHLEMLREAVIKADTQPITSSREKYKKETALENGGIIYEPADILGEITASAYDVSELLVAGYANSGELSGKDKEVLAGASKNIAELIKSTNFDFDTSFEIKKFFMRLLFRNINFHKNRNNKFRVDQSKGVRRTFLGENMIKENIADRLVGQLIGAVDMELAVLLALRESVFVKEENVELSDPRDDVYDGSDLVFLPDTDCSEFKLSKNFFDSAGYNKFKDYLKREKVSVQVKSHFMEEGVPNGMVIKLRDTRDIKNSKYDSGGKKCEITVDVFYGPSVMSSLPVRIGDDEIHISQLDFGSVKRANVEDFETLPDILAASYQKNRTEVANVTSQKRINF